MDGLLFAWILMLSSLLVEVSGQPSASLPAITDETFINDCVDAHNKARLSVQPPASDMLHMTWDEGLAITARAWARNCEFSHNPSPVHPVFSSVGENIWTGPTSIFGTKSAIDLWVNEKEYYTYTTMACAKAPCGHYTQVVRASSYKVGCAVRHCPNGVKYTHFKDGAVFVCNYGPGGNYLGQRPYTEDTTLTSCGTSCLAVLIIRPLALLCTFAATFTVKHFYPNIFCYE